MGIIEHAQIFCNENNLAVVKKKKKKAYRYCKTNK